MRGKPSVEGARITIPGLEFENPAIAHYLRMIPEEDRAGALVKALEVGVFCLERAGAGQDVEFVRHQVELLVKQVEKEVGLIPGATQKALIEKIGDRDGQVLAPVRGMVENAQKSVAEKLSDIRSMLQGELDPRSQTTTLGRALASLKDLLDPERTDSIQGRLTQAVRNVAGAEGELQRVVKAVVAEGIKPLAEEVNRLAKDIKAGEAAQEVVDQTTLKGKSFEEEVVERVREWAAVAGAEVEHVGGDNQPGDVVVRMAGSSLAGAEGLTVVVDAKDRGAAVGRKAIMDQLTGIMNCSNASHGIWVSRGPQGFAKEIGEWGEGSCDRGPWIACTFDLLPLALRFLVVQERLRILRQARKEVDVSSILEQVTRIQTALKKIGNITRKVTDIRGSAQEIQDESESLRDEVKAGLAGIEDALRKQAVGTEAAA